MPLKNSRLQKTGSKEMNLESVFLFSESSTKEASLKVSRDAFSFLATR